MTDVYELANSAIESYDAWQKHSTTCRQCRWSPEFCPTKDIYMGNFRKEYDRWKRAVERAKLQAVGSA